MYIRKYVQSDCSNLIRLFYETVHSVNAADYSEEQLSAWAPGNVDFKKWNESLSAHYTLVAVKDDQIVGFGDIDGTGYLDRLYVHKDYQKQGIASAICDELEKAVQADKITVYASITAKPFFTRRGYKLLKEQQVERTGIFLTNYVMERIL